MKVYEFHNADNQAYLYAVDDICDRCFPDPPRPLAGCWSPPTFELVGHDELRSYLPKTDFPALLPGIMVLSARAMERLRPMLESCGEILRIDLSNDRDVFYLFNVTRLVDVVDMDRSKFMELPSGAIGPCEHLALDPTKVPPGAAFFKTSQIVPVTSLFATETAVNAVRNARLTGHAFSLAWTDE